MCAHFGPITASLLLYISLPMYNPLLSTCCLSLYEGAPPWGSEGKRWEDFSSFRHYFCGTSAFSGRLFFSCCNAKQSCLPTLLCGFVLLAALRCLPACFELMRTVM